jgi:hypothetical protein
MMRRTRWAEHVALMEEMANTYTILVGKPEFKRTFGRSRRRWEDFIKMDFQGVVWEGVYWINLAQDTV